MRPCKSPQEIGQYGSTDFTAGGNSVATPMLYRAASIDGPVVTLPAGEKKVNDDYF